ncbi:hypothetical protein [Mesobacillus subterraneus]|uniref:Uncharacterized protein n=1 Tax=Mesobacillus subterraneus TaxID=285983 RepID=A0A3R9FTV9_9BACI|nr:hypothetical protein [Mesobacillus subterraneus]RSD24991.1 hypothetical protein EJA10_18555 [Mesobacillus subterraneus]
MSRIKVILSIVLMLVVLCTLTIYWAYHHKIISGSYDTLTISAMTGEEMAIIEDENEITRIVMEINESPRTFKYNTGLTYDYLPHGILTFENENEKLQISILMNNGNTITKYLQIHTDFNFGKDPNN